MPPTTALVLTSTSADSKDDSKDDREDDREGAGREDNEEDKWQGRQRVRSAAERAVRGPRRGYGSMAENESHSRERATHGGA